MSTSNRFNVLNAASAHTDEGTNDSLVMFAPRSMSWADEKEEEVAAEEALKAALVSTNAREVEADAKGWETVEKAKRTLLHEKEVTEVGSTHGTEAVEQATALPDAAPSESAPESRQTSTTSDLGTKSDGAIASSLATPAAIPSKSALISDASEEADTLEAFLSPMGPDAIDASSSSSVASTPTNRGEAPVDDTSSTPTTSESSLHSRNDFINSTPAVWESLHLTPETKAPSDVRASYVEIASSSITPAKGSLVESGFLPLLGQNGNCVEEAPVSWPSVHVTSTEEASPKMPVKLKRSRAQRRKEKKAGESDQVAAESSKRVLPTADDTPSEGHQKPASTSNKTNHLAARPSETIAPLAFSKDSLSKDPQDGSTTTISTELKSLPSTPELIAVPMPIPLTLTPKSASHEPVVPRKKKNRTKAKRAAAKKRAAAATATSPDSEDNLDAELSDPAQRVAGSDEEAEEDFIEALQEQSKKPSGAQRRRAAKVKADAVVKAAREVSTRGESSRPAGSGVRYNMMRFAMLFTFIMFCLFLAVVYYLI